MPIHRLEEEVFPESKPRSGQLPSLGIDHDLGLSPDLKDRNLEVKVDPEQPWTAKEKKGPKRKTILIIAGTMALLAALLFLTFKFTRVPQGGELSSSARPIPNTSPSLMETGNVAEIRSATQAAVRGFMDASNYTDRCNFVVGGSELEERMLEFYQRPDNRIPNDFGRLAEVQPIALSGTLLQSVSALEENNRVGWNFNLCPMPHRMLIDWESSVAYGEKSWPALLSDRSPEPVAMRIYLKRCYRFVEPYDEKRYEAFEITNRDYQVRIYGYARRDSTVSSQLTLAVPWGASQPVHVKLQWAATARDDQSIEITSFLHNYWIDLDRIERIYALEPILVTPTQ